jgi:5,5'-dehydrodivanillate O-demethylase
MGGLVFAYLGDDEKSMPPLFDLLVDEGVERQIRAAVIPCNWLQIVENGLDPVHIEWLHGHYANYRNQLAGAPPVYDVAKHGDIDFDVTDLGIIKRRVNEGRPHTDEDWTVGQLVIFPAALNISNRYFRSMQYRVPIDDEHTYHIWYEVRDSADAVASETTVTEADVYLPDGNYNLDTIDGQDLMAWVTQGVIADRTTERLGSADRGITLMRRLLLAELDAMAEGRRPRWTDFGANGEPISLPRRRTCQPVLTERS